MGFDIPRSMEWICDDNRLGIWHDCAISCNSQRELHAATSTASSSVCARQTINGIIYLGAMSSSYSKRRFVWSSKEFTVSQLVADYSHLLPFPVLVTRGCTERKQPKLSLIEDQVYWVHDVVKCPYVIVESASGQLMKIPECYQTMVIPLLMDGKEGEDFPFSEIRTRTGFRYFRFVNPEQEVFAEDGQQVKDSALTAWYLKVVDIRDVDMLVVHSILMENLMAPCKRGDSKVVEHKVVPRYFKLLPTYLPVTVSVALSLASAPEILFFKTVADIEKIVDSYQHAYLSAMKEVAEIVLDTAETRGPVYWQLDEVIQPLNPVAGQSEEVNIRKHLERIRIFCSTGRLVERTEEPASLVDCGTYLDMGTCRNLAEVDKDPRPKDPSMKIRTMTKSASERSLSTAFDQSGDAQSATPGLRRKLPGSAERPRHPSIGSLTGHSPASPIQHRLVSELKSRMIRNNSMDNLAAGMAPLAALGSNRRRFGSNKDVTDDVSSLSIEQLADRLILLNLSKYVARMRDKMVDGKLLKCLDENILKNEFGFDDADATKLMTYVRRGTCS